MGEFSFPTASAAGHALRIQRVGGGATPKGDAPTAESVRELVAAIDDFGGLVIPEGVVMPQDQAERSWTDFEAICRSLFDGGRQSSILAAREAFSQGYPAEDFPDALAMFDACVLARLRSGDVPQPVPLGAPPGGGGGGLATPAARAVGGPVFVPPPPANGSAYTDQELADMLPPLFGLADGPNRVGHVVSVGEQRSGVGLSNTEALQRSIEGKPAAELRAVLNGFGTDSRTQQRLAGVALDMLRRHSADLASLARAYPALDGRSISRAQVIEIAESFDLGKVATVNLDFATNKRVDADGNPLSNDSRLEAVLIGNGSPELNTLRRLMGAYGPEASEALSGQLLKRLGMDVEPPSGAGAASDIFISGIDRLPTARFGTAQLIHRAATVPAFLSVALAPGGVITAAQQKEQVLSNSEALKLSLANGGEAGVVATARKKLAEECDDDPLVMEQFDGLLLDRLRLADPNILFTGGEQGMPSPDDVAQSWWGDCYFLAPLAGIAEKDPQFIKDLIQFDPITGSFNVRLYREPQGDWVGAPEPIVVNVTAAELLDSFYRGGGSTVDNGGPGLNGQFSGVVNGAVWPAVLEIAFAKMNDGDPRDGLQQGFEDIGNLGLVARAYRVLTGNVGRYLPAADEGVLEEIQDALADNRIVVLGTNHEAGGLQAGHAYTVTNVITDASGTWLEVRNPYGHNRAPDPPIPPGRIVSEDATIRVKWEGLREEGNSIDISDPISS